MKYFSNNLTKEQLTVEYRNLAKKYHPDVCNNPKANEIMAEINREYDNYYVQIQKVDIGFDWDDLFRKYREASRSRTQILRFLRFDKQTGKGWFFLEKYGWVFKTFVKYVSDNNPYWSQFKGGFKLVTITGGANEYGDSYFAPVDCSISCPSMRDMYFSMVGLSDESSSLMSEEQSRLNGAYVSEYGTYKLVHTKHHGDMWVDEYGSASYRPAYIKVNGLVMSCPVPQKILTDAVTLKTVIGNDFGYLIFQDCSFNEFVETHDVNYEPAYCSAVNCKPVDRESEMFWVDDPVVAHFARLGVVKLYQSKTNFRMRYGTFSKTDLEKHLHELTIDEAEQIQDFLDKINGDFEESIKRMIKKGTIRIKV